MSSQLLIDFSDIFQSTNNPPRPARKSQIHIKEALVPLKSDENISNITKLATLAATTESAPLFARYKSALNSQIHAENDINSLNDELSVKEDKFVDAVERLKLLVLNEQPLNYKITVNNALPLPAAPEYKTREDNPNYHDIVLSNWENDIVWGARDDPKKLSALANRYIATHTHMNTATNTVNDNNVGQMILKQPMSSDLESIDLMQFVAIVDQSAEKKAEFYDRLAKNGPLVLNSEYLFQSLNIPDSTRPTPFYETAMVKKRQEKELTSNTSIFVSSLTQNDPKLADEIAKKQEKRAQMAKEKASRVTDAIQELDLGGGKGRTITSSLMGPGGTERTGRPVKGDGGSTAIHDLEVIEHLDPVYNHTFVREFRRSEWRQFHRPRLYGSLARSDRPWLFTARVGSRSNKKNNKVEYDAEGAMITGAFTIGAITSEAHLSPMDGNFVIIEYTEEFPPLHLAKGMGSKIVNYFRGDRSKCPISKGGGDRPIKKKKITRKEASKEAQEEKDDEAIRLDGPGAIKGKDMLGLLGLRQNEGKREELRKKKEMEAKKVLPEGVTEILRHGDHGPFIGQIEDGKVQSGLVCNLFAAPLFRHEPAETDFLMIVSPKGLNSGSSKTASDHNTVSVMIRALPKSLFTAGQVEPRTKCFAPNSPGDKQFSQPFMNYQIAKTLQRTENREGRGLKFDEISGNLTHADMKDAAIRARIKTVAVHDKNTGLYTLKPIGYEDFPGVEALARSVDPEGICAYNSARSASKCMNDYGITELCVGGKTLNDIAAALNYLKAEMNNTKERISILEKRVRVGRVRGKRAFYEKAIEMLKERLVTMKKNIEISRFIYEELLISPWNVTQEFIDVHKNSQGSGMLQLTGLGDPSGCGEAFSFLRVHDAKIKAGETGGQKKLTGTKDDLRKLSMKEMRQKLRLYGLDEKRIMTLKRWDCVHIIRDFATRASADGMELDRNFARGEKMKLSDQKEMYRERIQEIWKRQQDALSKEPKQQAGAAAEVSDANKADNNDDEDDSDSSEDDLLHDFEEQLATDREKNEVIEATGNRKDMDITQDATDLMAFRKEREEELAADKASGASSQKASTSKAKAGQKVIRRKVTKIHPDGTVENTFRFIVPEKEVRRIIAMNKEKEAKEAEGTGRGRKKKSSQQITFHGEEGRQKGHAIFEEEDDDYVVSKRTIRIQRNKQGRRSPAGASRSGFSSQGSFTSLDKRSRKRQRAAEERDLYANTKIKTSKASRRERGSARSKLPHVVLSDRFEQIRSKVESRPFAGPFLRPVDRRLYPAYYERIANPIDLQTIRDNNRSYQYRDAESFLKEFELMKLNAIKFNGPAHPIAQEGTNIYEAVKNEIESNRAEFNQMEENVREQLSGKKKKSKTKSTTSSENTARIMLDGVATTVNVGDIETTYYDSDSDDEY